MLHQRWLYVAEHTSSTFWLLQTEAEVLGAAQSTTGSLQRSRQFMLEQVDSTQTLLASMDASHAQLQKVTTEYQGQSDVFGSSKRLLRTLKRHSTWDKFVLYGGFAMLLLVCLYVVQKRARYFVPTFVKTGLGKLVPSWSRSSAQDLDDLTRPVKGVFQCTDLSSRFCLLDIFDVSQAFKCCSLGSQAILWQPCTANLTLVALKLFHLSMRAVWPVGRRSHVHHY